MNINVKKILNIALKAVTWLLVAFTVFMMIFTIVTVSTVDKNERSIFDTRFYIVKTDSMSLSENNKDMDVHFNAGDIVMVKTVEDPTKLEAGDIIAFLSTNDSSFGETVTHMIREVKRDESGRLLGYQTFGTNTGVDDDALVEPSYVLGKYSGKLPGIGNFFAFVKSTPGYIVCILVPFLLLIIYNGVNVIRLFRRYKMEQNELIEAERAEIAAERKQNEDMLKELLALKAQLEQQTGSNSTSSDTTVASENTEVIVEQVSEITEVTEEVTEEVIEEVTEEVVEEATEEMVEEATEEVVEEATEEVAKEPTEEVVEEATEEVAKEPTTEETKEVTESIETTEQGSNE